jgi:ABC-type transport system involved in cytochrome c biogenesis permease component
MKAATSHRIDGYAVAAAVIAVLMSGTYAWLMQVQGDRPRWWFLCLLLGGALLAAYGALPGVPYRRITLAVAAAVLLSAGVLALPSIGLPVVAAGTLAVLACRRPVHRAAH